MGKSINSFNKSLEWLIPSHPNWPTNVKTLMSTRIGGHSQGPYESLNLGNHVGDDPILVRKNREHHQQLIGNRPVYLKQVHKSDVVVLDPTTADDSQGDVCLTIHKNLSCTIMVADCLPILITNRQGTLVGAAHAGWRGLAGVDCLDGLGVVEKLLIELGKLARNYSGNQQQWLAWLGPCIGPKYFEVGEEVRRAFLSIPQASKYFKASPARQVLGAGEHKWLANLGGLAKLKLNQQGVEIILGNDLGANGDDWCTYANSELFFSHRRDKVSGRMAASIWMT